MTMNRTGLGLGTALEPGLDQGLGPGLGLEQDYTFISWFETGFVIFPCFKSLSPNHRQTHYQ